MKFYFTLQYRMMGRRLREFGVAPVIGYVGALAVYALGSYYLFEVTGLAAYIYAFLALFFVGRLSEADRCDFLKSINTTAGLRRIRLAENGAHALPFLAFLLFQQEFLMVAIVLLLSLLLALLNIKSSSSRSIPTPFSKRPFEFSSGFRRTWPVFLLSFFLTYMAIVTPNFGIGILALLLIFFTCATNYLEPEPKYYVWIFARTPRKFLDYKVLTGLYQMTVLCLPIIIALSAFFWEDAVVMVPIMVVFWMYLATLIYAKYSAFPDELSLPQGLLYALSFAFPPILLIAASYFYRRSNANLRKLLK